MEAKNNVCGICETVILNPVPDKKAACGTHFVHDRCFRPADDVYGAKKPGCQICFSKCKFTVIQSGDGTPTQKKTYNLAMKILFENNSNSF